MNFVCLLCPPTFEARGPAQQQAVCGVNSAPSEAANSIWWRWAELNRRLKELSQRRLRVYPCRTGRSDSWFLWTA